MTKRSVAIIGDGKMGQAIRQLAIEKGWNVAAMIGERESAGGSGIGKRTLGNADVAVEFTQPDAAVANIAASLRAGVPVVVGTTGWYDALPEVTRIAKETGTGLLWSPNFSLGVNVLIELARYAGTLMRSLDGFDAHIVETHHSRKKTRPPGRRSRSARRRVTPLTVRYRLRVSEQARYRGPTSSCSTERSSSYPSPTSRGTAGYSPMELSRRLAG